MLNHEATNYGYELVHKDTGNVLKYGKTLYPDTRYSKRFLEEKEAVMNVLVEGVSKKCIIGNMK